MSFFGKIWDGIKTIGSKVKDGVKWLGEKAKNIYAKGKEFVENNPAIQKIWSTIRNIEIPKLGISAGSLMDTIKGTAEGIHDTVVDSRDIGDVVSGAQRTLDTVKRTQPKFERTTGILQQGMDRYIKPASGIVSDAMMRYRG
jgi:hypothetical protein